MAADTPSRRHSAARRYDNVWSLFTAEEVAEALRPLLPEEEVRAMVSAWYAAEGTGWQVYGEELWNALSRHSPELAARVREVLGETREQEAARLARSAHTEELPPDDPPRGT